MTDYLTFAEVLAIHDDHIERYGGSTGVREPSVLEAAFFRPQTGLLRRPDRRGGGHTLPDPGRHGRCSPIRVQRFQSPRLLWARHLSVSASATMCCCDDGF
jgi:hypothetical protein